MDKKIGIITMNRGAGKKYAEQIEEVFGNAVRITLYSMDQGPLLEIHRADLYLVSISAIESCMEMNLNLPIGARILDIGVDFTLDAIRQLKTLPRGSKVLFVNSSEFLVAESVTRLQQLGIHHIEFIPYYSQIFPAPELSIAVTPGEPALVPESIKTVIDLGHRKLSPQMIMEIALELKLKEILNSPTYQNYILQFHLDSYRNLNANLKKSVYIEDCFEVFLESLDDGVVGADENGEIFCFNKKAADILNCHADNMVGRHIDEELDFLPFLKCKTDCLTVENTVKSMGGVFVSYSLKPIINNNKFRGVFAVFQRFTEAERKQQEARMRVLNKGHAAKYNFKDILGESQVMKTTKELALRMAVTDFTVLLYGESGTGKEIFASAIHNASTRSPYPFVAINCAAMPETLLESELFGYEDGAFTGAKKGGRLGLFELAHQGTLFLDEIENMSPALQVKLLRVLQEREVMRVGGHQTIKVDVRIVAATNEDLEIAVKNGVFRKDLYYRLSTLPICLPPLNDRREDVLLLFDYFKARYDKQFEVSAEVKSALLQHHWDGNVRELQNYIEYFLCLGKAVIETADLPKQFFSFSQDTCNKSTLTFMEASCTPKTDSLYDYNENHRLVLSVLHEAYKDRSHLGRNTISAKAWERGVFLTEQEVRTILKHLDRLGLVTVARGRSGTKLTPNGLRLAESIT